MSCSPAPTAIPNNKTFQRISIGVSQIVFYAIGRRD
jgi:hypothetical protein